MSLTPLFELHGDVQAFCEERDGDQVHDPLLLVIGASTEASELLDIFRFRQPDELEDVLEENSGRSEASRSRIVVIRSF